MALIPSVTTPPPPVYILSALGSHIPHGFILLQSTQQWGKRPLHIKGRSLLISTSPYASVGDVGLHGMQDPPFGSLQSTPLTGTRVLTCGAHISGYGIVLIPSVMTPPHLCRYCSLCGLIPLTVLFSSKAHSSGGKDLYTLKGGHSL